jgi:hypothetical protein
MYLISTFGNYAILALLLLVGIFGFWLGTGQANWWIAPRDYWAKSPAEVLGEKLKIGCGTSIALMFLVGWLLKEWLE